MKIKLITIFLMVLISISISVTAATFNMGQITAPSSCISGQSCSVSVTVKNTGTTSDTKRVECGIYAVNAYDVNQVLYSGGITYPNCYPSEEFVKTKLITLASGESQTLSFLLTAPTQYSRLGDGTINWGDSFQIICDNFRCCYYEVDQATGLCPDGKPAWGEYNYVKQPITITTSEPPEPPESKCTDGTPYNTCSVTKPKYCSNGNLIYKCSKCGCPSGQTCNTATEKCISNQVCTDGTQVNQCSSQNPKRCVLQGDTPTLVDNCDICGCTTGTCDTITKKCVTQPPSPPSCTNGATQPCMVNGEIGTQICVNGVWSSCVVGKQCEEGTIRVCENENGDKGTQTCENGKWSECNVKSYEWILYVVFAVIFITIFGLIIWLVRKIK